MEQKLKYFFFFIITFTCFANCKSRPDQVANNIDVPPGSGKATLLLNDGELIDLEKAAKGQLAMQGTTRIIKTADDEISYSSLTGPDHPDTSAAALQNTLTVPRGGRFKLILPDGTKVWLNSSSSLIYPPLFTKQKTVRLRGEGYFETLPGPHVIFTVKTYRDPVKATPASAFNVSCYDDDRFIRSSSISGTITDGGNKFKNNEAFENGLVIPVNAMQEAAWSRDTFDFNNVFVEEAMKDLSRWYNIEIVYDMGIPMKPLHGSASRNLSLRELLKHFEGQVAEFEIRKDALYVRPKM